MACLICGSRNASELLFTYNEPDKYELWMGIKHPHREWRRCGVCGFCSQYRNYKLSILEGIYKSAYRDPGFRDETIAQAYARIMALPEDESENSQRYEWLSDVLPMTEGRMLDIGSGIGVWPAIMRGEWDVTCTEENDYSIDFIKNVLLMPCLSKPGGRYDLVSVVHVLEHVSDPKQFLEALSAHTEDYLFVEVPDAQEFGFLPKDHDEFNSCHEWFFTMPTLCTLIEKSGYLVKDATRKFYPQRQLSRLLVLAQCD